MSEMAMAESLRRVLRTTQTYFPWSRALKFETYNFMTRHLGIHVEPEFRLLGALRAPLVAIDVGGNWGQSIEAIRYYADPDLIVSFEPNPALAQRLERIYCRDRRIRVHPFGLSSRETVDTLYTPIYSGFAFDGAASFDEAAASDFVNARRMAWFKPERLVIHKEPAKIKRLDDLGLSPSIAKIDVQGFELEVLKGGHRTFSRCRPFTILENPSKGIVDYFAALEMRPYVLNGSELIEGETSGNNTIFMTKDHQALFASRRSVQ
jgi:FkbM family methyltransferase